MKNVLDELNKGTTMGIDAINFTLEKVKDDNLKNVLTRLKKMYQDVSNKINRMYDGKPHETNILNKAMTWYGIEMKTMMDDSSSKISELIISKHARSKGVGQKLIKKMEEYFKQINCEYILIDVFAYNKNAIKFYNRQGYHTREIINIKKI